MRATSGATWAAGIGALGIVAVGIGWFGLARGGSGEDLPVYWDAPSFTLLDQRADTVGSSDLRGAPWVASFVFTSCTDFCPTITQRMAALRDRLEESGSLGTRVRLVSFTVDPERDTPEVLREYAAAYGGSPPAEWAFLTGQDGPAVRRLIEEGFRLTASAPEHAQGDHDAGDYQVMHSPRLVLVDSDGLVRGTYDATEPGAVDAVVADLRTLRR